MKLPQPEDGRVRNLLKVTVVAFAGLLVSMPLPGQTGPLSITTATPLLTAETVHYYSVTFAVTGGSGPYTWQEVVGVGVSGIPPGLTLSSFGTLSGTPTVPGTYPFYPEGDGFRGADHPEDLLGARNSRRPRG